MTYNDMKMLYISIASHFITKRANFMHTCTCTLNIDACESIYLEIECLQPFSCYYSTHASLHAEHPLQDRWT